MKIDWKTLFGSAKPSVRKFRAYVNQCAPEERNKVCKRLFAAAFSEWPGLSADHRHFLINLIKSERQAFVDFLRTETVWGGLLYEADEEALLMLLKFVNVWLHLFKNPKTSYTKISFALLLSFSINLSVKSLSDKIRYAWPDTFDFCEWMEQSNGMGN